MTMRYKASCITHVLTSLTIGLILHTEDPDGVGDTFNSFLLPGLYLSTVSKVAIVESGWYTALCITTMTTYAETVSLLQIQCISIIED